MYFPLFFTVSPHCSVSLFYVSVIEISQFLLEEFVQISLQFYAIIELHRAKRSKANEIEAIGAKSGEYGECIQQIMSKTFISCSLDTLFY